MSRHPAYLLGEALAELEKHDPDAAAKIAADVSPLDAAGVRNGRRGRDVIEPSVYTFGPVGSERAQFRYDVHALQRPPVVAETKLAELDGLGVPS